MRGFSMLYRAVVGSRIVFLSLIFELISCYSTPTSTQSSPPRPTNVLVSKQEINVDWSNSTGSIRDEVIDVVQKNLRSYEYYYVSYETFDNSENLSWYNVIRFATYSNPSYEKIELVFNYFRIAFYFAHDQLRSGSDRYRASPYFSYDSLDIFTENVNEVLSRTSLEMRGKTFSNKELYNVDMIWLKALRFQ